MKKRSISVQRVGFGLFLCNPKYPKTSKLEQTITLHIEGHFTHATESPWPVHFKHSHWWERQSWSKFTSHYTWGTNRVCERKMDVQSTCIPPWHQMNHVSWSLGLFSKPPLGGRPNTKPGNHGTPTAHTRWFILIYHAWRPAWIEIHWNSIQLRTQSHMTSHYTWRPVTTLHDDFRGVLGRPLDTFFWALTIPWSRLLVRVWSGPELTRHITYLLGTSTIVMQEYYI